MSPRTDRREKGVLIFTITIVSNRSRHELRNSINPILQSALLIKASLLEARRDGSETPDSLKSSDGIDIQEDLEACDAIIDSANQMERVANDVLGETQCSER